MRNVLYKNILIFYLLYSTLSRETNRVQTETPFGGNFCSGSLPFSVKKASMVMISAMDVVFF